MDVKHDKKKRKWDVPGTAPATLAATTPSILGQSFGTAPGQVAASSLLHNMPHLGMAQPGPAGVPGSSAAEEIRKKINQTLIQRGIIAGPKVDDSAVEKEIIINEAPGSIRSQLTRRPVQEEIQRETGSVIITRGRYKPPGAPLDDREKPLHLHISPGAHLPNEIAKQRAVEHAATIIDDILKGGPGLRPRQGIVRPPVTAMHTLFLHVGIEADPGFGLAARIRGSNNSYLDHISNESGAVLELRGRGSGTKEGPLGEEKDEPLQLVLMCSTAAGLEQAKKLASNLLDTIRTDWEKHSKPATPPASSAPTPPTATPPQYPPYYYGYPPYAAYPGGPPPYGAAPPYYPPYYAPPGAAGAPPGGGGPSSGYPASGPQVTAAPANTPAQGDPYPHPPQAPAASQAPASLAYPGGAPQSAAAAPQAGQPAGYTPPQYMPPQDEKKGIPPPPPDSRPPPPQSPAQAAPSPAPYQPTPQFQQQQQQAPYSPPSQYAPPDSYQQQPRQAGPPPASSAPPPPTEASPPPPPEAVPLPPSEEAPPAPPADASSRYQGYQYPAQAQQAPPYAPPGQQPAEAPGQYRPQSQQEIPHGQYPPHRQQAPAPGPYPAQGQQEAAPGPYLQQGQYPPPGQQQAQAQGQYSAQNGSYSAPGGSSSGYTLPGSSYPPIPPQDAHQTAPPPSQQQQQQQQYPPAQAAPQAAATPGAYQPPGVYSQQQQGRYQQPPSGQQGPPASYHGGAYNAAYAPGPSPGSAYQPGGPAQRTAQPAEQQQGPEGEKKRKFQEFPTGGRGMQVQPANKAPPPFPTPGPSPGYRPLQGMGLRAGPASGMGLMGPPPARSLGAPPLRGAMQPMGPPMNRPPLQNVQAYGVKLVDYGEEEEDESFRGTMIRPPHLRPQSSQGGQRPFWHPRG